MRNALIVLVVVALALVTLGAFNSGLLFDIDLVAGTWTAVSLFWVAVVIAGVVFVTGVVAAFLARSSAVATRRKLEKELQGTYERLRDAEAQVPMPASSQAAVDVTPAGATAVTGVAAAPTASPEAETAMVNASPEAETAVVSATPEAETAVTSASPEAETAVTTVAPAANVADDPPPVVS